MTLKREIQLFKPIFNKEEIIKQISECLDKGWTGLGFKTLEFEEKFKDYTKVSNAHFLNSATSGLHLALEIIKKVHPELDYVVTSPLTFISDSHVIKHANLIPKFLDVGPDLCINPELLEKYLDEYSHGVLAVIYIGIGGNTGDLDSIVKICKKYNISLILDASHMMGTYYNGFHIGNEADFTVFSFQSVKNLPTADSGMLICKNPKHDELARKLSWLGINKDTYSRQTEGGNWEYSVEDIGWKYHGNSIMAAMGIAGLEKLSEQNNIRRYHAGIYRKDLSTFYNTIPINENCISSYHLYQVRVPEEHRDRIIKCARNFGIQLGVHYKSHKEYNIYKHYDYNTPNADTCSKQLISLPIGPHLNFEDIEFVCEVLNAYPF